MIKYEILLDESLASIYEEIAVLSGKQTEEILQETLIKVIHIMGRKI